MTLAEAARKEGYKSLQRFAMKILNNPNEYNKSLVNKAKQFTEQLQPDNRQELKGGGSMSGAKEIGNFAAQQANVIDQATGEGQSDWGQAASGALKGASAGMALGPWGAAAGAVVGGVGGFIKGSAAEDAREKAERQKQKQLALNRNQYLDEQNQGGPAIQSFAKGGQMKLKEFNGPQHNSGGIPIGQNAEVEGGETEGFGNTEDYVFSDTLKPTGSNKTFAELSKEINKKYEDKENDPLALESKEKELSQLMQQQEAMQSKNKSNKDNSRKKLQEGGDIPPWQEIVNKGRALKPNEDVSNYTALNNVKGMPEGAKVYRDSSGNIKFDETTIPASDNIGKDPGKEAAIDAILRKSKEQGKFVTNVYPKYNNEARKRYKATLSTNNNYIYSQPNNGGKVGEPSVPKLETPEGIGEVDINKNTTPSDITTTGGGNQLETGYQPYRPSLMGALGNAAVGAAQGLGNIALANRLDYETMSPQQVNPKYVDPTRAINEVRTARAGARDTINQASRGTGNLLSNLTSNATQEDKSISETVYNYDKTNAQISNQAQRTNAQMAQQADQYNTQIENKEIQDRLNLISAGIGQIGSGITKGINAYQNEKRFGNMLPTLNEPNYGSMGTREENIWGKPKRGETVGWYRGEDGKIYKRGAGVTSNSSSEEQYNFNYSNNSINPEKIPRVEVPKVGNPNLEGIGQMDENVIDENVNENTYKYPKGFLNRNQHWMIR